MSVHIKSSESLESNRLFKLIEIDNCLPNALILSLLLSEYHELVALKEQLYSDRRKLRKRTCAICDKLFPNVDEKEYHIKQDHPEYTRCPQKCGRYFNNKEEFEAHMKTHDKKYICYQCGEVCDSSSKLLYHTTTR